MFRPCVAGAPQYAFGCTLYEIAHIGTGGSCVAPRVRERPGAAGHHAARHEHLTSTSLISAGSSLGFGPNELLTAWSSAHEYSEWWGDPVLLKLPAIASAVKRADERFQLAVRSHVPAVFADLIVRCTAFDPAQRPTFAELRRVLMEAVEAGGVEAVLGAPGATGLVVGRSSQPPSDAVSAFTLPCSSPHDGYEHCLEESLFEGQ